MGPPYFSNDRSVIVGAGAHRAERVRLNTAVYNALGEAGIEIPFPQRVVHRCPPLRSPECLEQSHESRTAMRPCQESSAS